MKTRAAIVRGNNGPWEIVELELDAPKRGEVQLRMAAAGLCHSDDMVRSGLTVVRLPAVAGHEGSAVVEAVGEGVTQIKPGDHVVLVFSPTCGQCRFCASGQSNLCDYGGIMTVGGLLDGTFRFHDGANDVGGMPGTFTERVTVSEHSVVVIPKEIPLDVAALLSCCVPTGWGSSVIVGGVKPGDTVMVIGTGGVGINAVQGAVIAGARYVIAVDPVAFKQEKSLEVGATHAVSNTDDAQKLLTELTRGVGADVAVVTTNWVEASHIRSAFDAIRKGGTVVVTGTAGSMDVNTVSLPGTILAWWHKTVRGAVYGGVNPQSDIPRLIELYQAGRLKLDELITQRYTLDQVNEGYADLHAGKNIRGVIDFTL